MKRMLAGILVVLIVASALSATEVTIGPKIAYQKSGYRGSDWSDFKDLFTDLSERFGPGFTAGIFINPQFTPLLGMEIDILYTHSAIRYGSSDYWMQDSFNSISVPVYLRLAFDANSVGLYLLAGPKFDYYFDTFKDKDSDGITGEYSMDYNDMNRFYVGMALGGGVAIPAGSGRVDIGIVYNTPFTKIDTAGSTEMYFEGFEIQLGYGFLL